MAPATRADESRSGRAASQRAQREACVRIEVATERGDDPTPLMPHEAAGDARCLAVRERRVHRPVGPRAGAVDVEDPEDVPDAVRRVHETPRADPERSRQTRVGARRRPRVRRDRRLECVAARDRAGELGLVRDGRRGGGRGCALAGRGPATGRRYGGRPRPTEGTIERSAGRAQVGYLGHEPLVYRELTALENLELYGRLYRVPERRERIGMLLERFGLWEARRDRVASYSRGMTQRLALCRVLLHDPQLLVLDEPYTALDTQGAELLDEQLRELGDKTFLVSTHDPERIAALATTTLALT